MDRALRAAPWSCRRPVGGQVGSARMRAGSGAVRQLCTWPHCALPPRSGTLPGSAAIPAACRRDGRRLAG
eukprot:1828154-Lingulodinium_polyedra.AAC.1